MTIDRYLSVKDICDLYASGILTMDEARESLGINVQPTKPNLLDETIKKAIPSREAPFGITHENPSTFPAV